MILVKDRTGSKNGTADSTLVGVFDSKRPLYRLVKCLILHIFPPVFRLLYGFRVVGRIPEEKMQNGCISVCNHVHKLDCVMLACVFQDYTMQFLSLESNLHIPIAGAIVRLMGGIGLPANLDGWRPVLKRIKQGLDEGQMLQIYPEGELIDGCRTLRRKRDGMELVILEPVDIPTDKKGKRAATELETQIRCQMEAARLAVGREGA